ncbi:hypothetical protein L228DRAFT_257440 [Xylona heveae TC161]|uniref:Golgi apparatus membrane protein TVP38 n=1 Tax=Xylona heveae (strain CBS 132557 / TC161) TaxID=1328760 RepID=A0A165J9C4_XYLHT|nr:hypothetical protein L228DRAFT_257440 [Xylona heveae TC161]KZF25926.1 hypothetical protein L228DRAFT_257440 [Xylona heveae TC161]
MSADYVSTARALAFPVSPPSPSRSPSLLDQPRGSWVRSRSRSSHRTSPSSPTPPNLKSRMRRNAELVHRRLSKAIRRLTPVQRFFAVLAGIVALVLGILILIYNERIFGWLAPMAHKWRTIPAGWLIVWFMAFVTAFPPLIGHSLSVTIAGFVYGFPNGWFIGASATIIGSTCAFLASRTLLSGFVHRLVAHDKRFAALSLTLKHDGLKLLCMIRLCPLPYAISNGAIATFPTVHPLKFALATALASPKLMIHVFIGTRLADLAESGGKMDLGTKAINYASIAGGLVLGAVTGWLIYQRTVARAKQLEAEEAANVQRAADEDGLQTYSDDPEERFAAEALRRGDEISLATQDHDADHYRDEEEDDNDDDNDDDVFRHGDGSDDEEHRVGMGNLDRSNSPGTNGQIRL